MKEYSDEQVMRLAVNEAKKGMGRTSPNPCVGAVIIKDGRIISKGYHKKAGTPHAEIHALNKAGREAEGATMYVTLEPCNHTGRTPPCSHAVAAAGIRKVVIGMLDPNPLVDGSGAEFLRSKGITVINGILEEQCRELNRPFIKMVTESVPWVVIKAGVSLDGKLNYQHGKGGVITGTESRRKVHRMRNCYDTILVGIGTVEVDDPSLTTRLPGNNGRDPVRIVLDSTLKISEQAQILTQESAAPTWIFCLDSVDQAKVERLQKGGTVIHMVRKGVSGLDLTEVVRVVAANGLSSILVEGGAAVHGAFLNERLVDRANLFFAPVFAGDRGVSLVSGLREPGGKEEAVRLSNVKTSRYGADVMISGDVCYPRHDDIVV